MPLIDERLAEKFGKDESYYDQRDSEYHLSSIGKCPRYIFLDRTQNRPEPEKNKRIFIMGKVIHEFLQKDIFGDYIQEEQLKYVKEGVTFVGRMDLYNEKEILELKSCSSMQYLVEPKPEHVVQTNCYMGIRGIHQAQIIYVNKMDFSTVSFSIKFSKELFDESINNIIKIDRKIQAGVDYHDIGQKIGHECKYCKYSDLCGFSREKQVKLNGK